MKIAVCDDQQNILDEIRAVWKQSIDDNFKYEYCEYTCAEDLLGSYRVKDNYDLLVLDIEMGEISGMEAAKRIRRIDKNVKIIFVTAYDQYIRDAFDVSAMYFLDKPIDSRKLEKLFRRCIREYREQNYAIFFSIINQRQVEEKMRLLIKDILYIESYVRHVVIHTIDGKEYKTKGKISEYEKELRSRNFVRIYMSFLVNVCYIHSITKEDVNLKYGDAEVRLPLSRKQKSLVESVFLDYRVGDYK